MATHAQVKAFIDRIAPIAQEQAIAHGNKIFASVCIAQACCESAYGTSKKMVQANALFGIKVGKSKYHYGKAWKDKAYSTKTKECYDGKTYTEITDMFRAYDSIEEAIEDYFDLLCVSSRYKYALNQQTPIECIRGIQKAPFATSPTYISTIMSIINKYNLTKYDNDAYISMDKISVDFNPFQEPETVIKMKSKGDGVRWVQWFLWRFGLISKSGIDGIFGINTYAAVVEAQKKLGLAADGIVGKLTKEAFAKTCETI